MKSKNIKITGINDLTDFVTKANEVEGDIIIQRGRYIVDGKSIMGLMSIDVSQGCKMEYPETAIEFEKYISKFEY